MNSQNLKMVCRDCV